VDFPPTYLQWFLIVSLPLMGVVYAFLGGIKLPLAERLKLDEGKVGGLVAGFGMMVGPIILASGFLTDEFGRKGVYQAGAVMVVLALLLIGWARTYAAAVVAVLLLGAGWSATINVANVLVPVAVRPEKLIAAFQFTDFLFGLGALATPLLLGLLLARVGYGGGVTVMALVSVAPIVMAVFAEMNLTPAGAPAAEASVAAAPAAFGLGDLFGSRLFWLTSLAFLFYVPLESSVASWATTIVGASPPPEPAPAFAVGSLADAPATGDGAKPPPAADAGATAPTPDDGLASLSLTGFWLCFTGSRLAVALLEGRDTMLPGLTVASLGVILGIVFLPGRWTAAGLVVAAGLIFGPIFPFLLSRILLNAPEEVHGRAVGFFFAFGSAGWTFIPALIGRVARNTDIRRGFLVAVGSAVLFLGLVLAEMATRP
jgi:fucose permease